MFNIFKKKKKKDSLPPLNDLNNKPLQEGDIVMSLRYEMGKCVIKKTEKGYEYESLETGKTVSWLKMIDASTENQKVKKVPRKKERENGQGS